MNYNLPGGYDFLHSLVRTYKQVKDPIGTMTESMERFQGTYSVNLGTRRMIVTQDQGFIEYVLKTHHKNYHKSPMVTDNLGKFLGNGLLTSNGDYWLKQRRMIQPGFHSEKIQALYSIIKRTIDTYLIDFPTGLEIDVYPLMNQLAFEIIINTLFNVHVPKENRDALNTIITETQAFVVKDLRQPYKSWWFRLSGEVKKHLDYSQQSRGIIRAIIQQRKESGQKYNDLLDMLLETRYEDNGQPMSEDQIIDEILVLLIAGHETTADALSWALYLLANHPVELEKLRQGTRLLTIEECVRHDGLACAIKETMRLYPPAWIADRVPLQDDAYNKYTYPKGTIILLFLYGLHHHESHWADPFSFVPDRFTKDSSHKDNVKAYYPFGAGPRLCIGNNFALAEMAIFIQTFIQHFNIKPTRTIPTRLPLVTLRPDKVLLNISRMA